jgi:hypothetical protein
MISMNTPDFSLFSRTGLEHAFAGLLFSATVALVACGALEMSLRAAFAA